jgi:type II secretory pathway pseudopilin PulG
MIEKQKKSRKNAGYTLIETLVSGMLLVFAVSGAVAVVSTGTQLGASDNERRQARAIIRSVFEQAYDYRDYNQIPGNIVTVEDVQIDDRMGNPLVGQLSRTITTENFVTAAGVSCAAKRITLNLQWASVDGITDHITLTKIVADAQ